MTAEDNMLVVTRLNAVADILREQLAEWYTFDGPSDYIEQEISTTDALLDHVQGTIDYLDRIA